MDVCGRKGELEADSGEEALSLRKLENDKTDYK